MDLEDLAPNIAAEWDHGTRNGKSARNIARSKAAKIKAARLGGLKGGRAVAEKARPKPPITLPTISIQKDMRLARDEALLELAATDADLI